MSRKKPKLKVGDLVLVDGGKRGKVVDVSRSGDFVRVAISDPGGSTQDWLWIDQVRAESQKDRQALVAHYIRELRAKIESIGGRLDKVTYEVP